MCMCWPHVAPFLVPLGDDEVVAGGRVDDVHLDGVRVRNAIAVVVLEEVDLLRAVAGDLVRGAHAEVASGDNDAVRVRLIGEDLGEG